MGDQKAEGQMSRRLLGLKSYHARRFPWLLGVWQLREQILPHDNISGSVQMIRDDVSL